MNGIFKCYRTLISFKLRAIQLLLVFVPLIFGVFFFAMQTYKTITPIFMGYGYVTLAVIVDFYIFGGVANKKVHSMEYLRSSYEGPGIIDKAIVGDLIMHAIRLLVLLTCSTVLQAKINGELDLPIDILIILGLFGVMFVSFEVALMITRLFAQSINAQIGFSYLVVTVLSFMIIVYVIFAMSEAIFLMAVFAAVMLFLALALSVILCRVCFEGFKSGYKDLN